MADEDESFAEENDSVQPVDDQTPAPPIDTKIEVELSVNRADGSVEVIEASGDKAFDRKALALRAKVIARREFAKQRYGTDAT